MIFRRKRECNSKKEDISISRFLEVSIEKSKDILLIRKSGNMANPEGSPLEDALRDTLISLVKNHPVKSYVIDSSDRCNSHYTLRISLEEEKGNVRYTNISNFFSSNSI